MSVKSQTEKDILSKLESRNNLQFESIVEKYKNSEKAILHYKKSLLINGDVLYENNFDEGTFDLIVTSPPYNVDIKYNLHKDDLSYDQYLSFSEKWMKNCFKWTKKQGRFCLNIPLDKNKGG